MKATPARDFYREIVLKFTGDECLIWPFNRVKGYALTHVNRKPKYVCRLALEELVGPPPTDKHQAAHSCGKGKNGCVNPKHLYWATQIENEIDKIRHGTKLHGSRHGASKLTEDQVREIFRLRKTKTNRAIAEIFGVANQTISKVLNGKNWSSVRNELPETETLLTVHRHTEVAMNSPFYPCGHPRTTENTAIYSANSSGRCRECLRIRKRKSYHLARNQRMTSTVKKAA
jgi:hypothetical protein